MKPPQRLCITLTGGNDPYHPGDTIHGYVSRSDWLIAPESSLIITLRGHSKVLFVQALHNPTKKQFRNLEPRRSDFVLIDPSPVEIHSGPIHVAPNAVEAERWPFAIPIPTHVATRVGDGQSQYASCLGLSVDAIASQPLPPSFIAKDRLRHTFQAKVEYTLEAKLTWKKNGTKGGERAYKEIDVQQINLRPARKNVSTSLFRWPGSVYTQLLSPGMDNATLTYTQRLQKRLFPFSVPKFAFHLEVCVPNAIQFNSGYRIPLKMRVVPDWDRARHTYEDTKRVARLTRLRLGITAITTGLVAVNGRKVDSSMKQMFNLAGDQALRNLGKEVYIPCSADEPTIDVGKLIGLSLAANQPQHAPSTWFKEPLHPGTLGYNFYHRHELHWKIGLEIHGEEVFMRGKSSVRLLPQTEHRSASPPSYRSGVN